MLLHQPQRELAQVLCQHLDERSGARPRWSDFRFASAWINEGGASALESSLAAYLAAGGRVRCTVGLDFSGTTEEGLKILVALQKQSRGRMDSYVYKNEWPGSTFHPKVYLLSDSTDAVLIVGSNNLTKAGLTVNVECSLAVSGALSAEPFSDAVAMLDEWAAPCGKVKKLDDQLLAKLKAGGYVQTELEKAARQSRERGAKSSNRVRLFDSEVVAAQSVQGRAGRAGAPRPRARAGSSARAGGSIGRPVVTTANTVIFKVRGHRVSQIQVPKQLRFSDFMLPALNIKSAHDDEVRPFGVSHRRGVPNYWYFEAPEVRSIPSDDPLLKLYWQDDQLWYRAVDPASQEGTQMLRALAAGRQMQPRETHDSKPGNPNTQSWRFLS